MSHSYLFDWDIGLFFHSFFFFVWYFQAVIFMSDWKRYQAYSSLVDVFWHLAEKEKKVWWYGLYFTHRWPERRGLHETCNVPMTWFRSPPKIYSFRRNKVIAHQALHTVPVKLLSVHTALYADWVHIVRWNEWVGNIVFSFVKHGNCFLFHEDFWIMREILESYWCVFEF